ATWQLCEALWTSKFNHLASFVAAGTTYNLIHREAEHELLPFCVKYGVGFAPTMPLAQGLLTGKYRQGEPLPRGARFTEAAPFASPVRRDMREYQDRLQRTDFAQLAALESFAQRSGHRLPTLAIAWLLAQPGVNTVPIGVSSSDQLLANLEG